MSGTDGAPDKPSPSQPADTAGSESAPSAMYVAFLRNVRRRKFFILSSQAALILLFIVIWEVAPQAHWVNPMLTSYPSAIWPSFLSQITEGTILTHTWVTLVETVVGFAISMILGIVIAVALWRWEFLYKVVDPFLVVANALPKIALVPIFYIWLGDKSSIYAMAVAVAVFITILMLYTSFRETDRNKIKLVQTFGATRWQILCKVVLPSSVPTMIAALKINIGLALVGVIVGEFQSAKEGLGYLIIYGSQIFAMDLVMTAIVILGIISTVMYLIILYVERKVVKFG